MTQYITGFLQFNNSFEIKKEKSKEYAFYKGLVERALTKSLKQLENKIEEKMKKIKCSV